MNFHQLLARLKTAQRPKGIIIPVSFKVKGEYQLRKLDGLTRELIEETPWFDNLVTDIGLDRLGSQSNHMLFCRIGTGTTAAANSDTQLQAQVASTSTTVGSPSASNIGSPTYASTTINVYEFALGAVVGNMAEVGVGWAASTASTLFSRARINDAGGSPTTITVLVTEILQVSYRFTVYPQVADASGTVSISSVSYSYTSRCYNASNIFTFGASSAFIGGIISPNAWTGALQAITATSGSGTAAALTIGTISGYTNGTYYVDYTLTAAIGSGNLSGGIKTIFGGLSPCSYVQCEFTPNIPKDNTKVLSITFRMSWTRH
jgi:hypothetical protein